MHKVHLVNGIRVISLLPPGPPRRDCAALGEMMGAGVQRYPIVEIDAGRVFTCNYQHINNQDV